MKIITRYNLSVFTKFFKILKAMTMKNQEAHRVTSRVTKKAIENSYRRVENELESLKQYDQGEKMIDAPNLKSPL